MIGCTSNEWCPPPWGLRDAGRLLSARGSVSSSSFSSTERGRRSLSSSCHLQWPVAPAPSSHPSVVCASSSLCSQSPAPVSTIPLVTWHLRVTSHLSVAQLTGSGSSSLLQVEMTTTSFLQSFGSLQGIFPLFCSISDFSNSAFFDGSAMPPPHPKKRGGGISIL